MGVIPTSFTVGKCRRRSYSPCDTNVHHDYLIVIRVLVYRQSQVKKLSALLDRVHESVL